MERCIGGYELPEIKHKRAGWPKQPPVHSPENRFGQAWRPIKTEGCVLSWQPDGHYTTDFKTHEILNGHFKCSCGCIVRIKGNGCAICEGCGDIFNDGGKRDCLSDRNKKRSMGNFRAACQRKA
jgi:hypothetical protein